MLDEGSLAGLVALKRASPRCRWVNLDSGLKTSATSMIPLRRGSMRALHHPSVAVAAPRSSLSLGLTGNVSEAWICHLSPPRPLPCCKGWESYRTGTTSWPVPHTPAPPYSTATCCCELSKREEPSNPRISRPLADMSPRQNRIRLPAKCIITMPSDCAEPGPGLLASFGGSRAGRPGLLTPAYPGWLVEVTRGEDRLLEPCLG